ncbi:MAG: type I-E CRISPR-associated protein Cas7/Cse4/CasC [Desulfovibrionales bacterium]|nr:type I-E CRISPR-associated protein Cas7/Cse4/CasC [Desulfovibrionales bacterium]
MKLEKQNTFLQLHILTAYPPSNLNRDESGMPKTAKFGSVNRGRISSQCNKYWYRNGDVFGSLVKGLHTRKYVSAIFAPCLEEHEVPEAEIRLWSTDVFKMLGGKVDEDASDPKSENLDETEPEIDDGKWAKFSHNQVIVIKAGEVKALEKIAADIATYVKKKEHPAYIDEIEKLRKDVASKKEKEEKADKGNKKRQSQAQKNPVADKLAEQMEIYAKDYAPSIDISLFGRMSASRPDWNVEAACQVAHSFTVHPIVNEVDYFTAVDDINKRGAALVSSAGFNSGVYYLYVCLDTKTLLENLKDRKLAKDVVDALVYSLVSVSPGGKQNSHASRALASFVLAEKGPIQPRSLAAAFLKPIRSEDVVNDSIEALKKVKTDFDSAYSFAKPDEKTGEYIFDIHKRVGSCEKLAEFCRDLPELNKE